MCIRDSGHADSGAVKVDDDRVEGEVFPPFSAAGNEREIKVCLLYTSDAADERSSVDLGGRRIIKKKNSQRIQQRTIPK